MARPRARRGGEIVIRGHNIMKGYWDREDANVEAINGRGLVPHRRHGQGGRGWVLLHRRPQEEPDHPRRRQRDLREVEEVLYEHRPCRRPPWSVCRDELGEEVGAAVVLKEGVSGRGRRAEATSRSRWPRTVSAKALVLGQLPKGPTGKILKREITVPERSSLDRS